MLIALVMIFILSVMGIGMMTGRIGGLHTYAPRILNLIDFVN